MLEPSTPNQFPNQIQIPKSPIIINSNSEYEISKILNSCIDKWCKCKLLYLVMWAGYEGMDEETSWLLASELGHASKVISDFHLAYPSKPGPLPLVESWHLHLLQTLKTNSLKKIKFFPRKSFFIFKRLCSFFSIVPLLQTLTSLILPCLIAKILSNPRLIPYHSPNSVPTILWDSDTTLPFPWTPTDPQGLWHYIITL